MALGERLTALGLVGRSTVPAAEGGADPAAGARRAVTAAAVRMGERLGKRPSSTPRCPPDQDATACGFIDSEKTAAPTSRPSRNKPARNRAAGYERE